MKKFLLLISCLFALGTTSALADGKWEKLTQDDQLSDGDIVTLVSQPATVTNVGDIPSLVSVSCANDLIKLNTFTLTDGAFSVEPLEIVLEKNGDGWNLKVGEQYLIAKSGKNNVYLDANAAAATITIDKNDLATIKVSTDSRMLQFNHNTNKNSKDYVAQSRIAFYKSTSNQKNCYLYRLTSTDPVTPSAVETPEIAIDDKNFVSITCATDGADIYYTLNGDAPTAESQKYDAPFELTASATVKAIAIKGEDKSNVASKTFTVVEKKSSLAGWTEWTENATFNITCPLTVVYKNGNNIYVKDAENNFALVYNQDGITLPDYVNGNVINGMTAKFIVYAASKLPELIPATVGEMTAGEAVEPVEITAADVTAENFFHYVKISGISVVAGKSGNFTLTDKEGTDAAMYNQFKLDFTPEEGAVYNAVGVIGAFKGTYQFQPIEITRALPDGALDFTTVDVEDSFAIGKDDDSATITVSGVHAESELYYKFTAAPAETAPEAAPRKVVDHTGYTKAVRNADGTHTIAVSEAGTLELYAYHPATDTKGDVKTIAITKDGTTAIDSIGTDVAEGEAEYFNLQGVKVDRENAAPGLYIRRQGSKVAKVIVK